MQNSKDIHYPGSNLLVLHTSRTRNQCTYGTKIAHCMCHIH